MLTIGAGHIIGIALPLLFFSTIRIMPAENGGALLTYTAVLAMIIFIEYQLVRSIRDGRLYWRGTVDRLDGAQFKMCQFSYSTLSGFMITIVLQNIF